MTKKQIREKLKIYLDKNDFNIPTFEDMVNFAQEIATKATKELKKENAELKDDNKVMANNYSKAKEILKKFLDNVEPYSIDNDVLVEAEQFLNSEVEE